ncbi:hypothetical protein CYMTET_34379 [Cymbomonas tetramitiformis]|nr:hypothetical protein CYMTET_34379 [Cymbomonas tetramitiformis]
MSKLHQKSTGWGSDATGVPMLLVSSVGTTLRGTDRQYRSHVPDEGCPGMLTIKTKSVIQPVVVAMWRLIFHVIDGHNRQRTGTVAMHDVWRTQSWEHRDFGEMFMIILVNAENAWKFFDSVGKVLLQQFKAGKQVNPRRDFLQNLCSELFHNPFLTADDVQCGEEFVSAEGATITQHSGQAEGRTSSGSGTGSCEIVPSKEHVPVTTEGQANIDATTVSSLLSAFCVPQPLPQGVQERCGVPTCSHVVMKKGETTFKAYKTSTKCGRCHMKEKDGKQLPAYVCSPLSGRTCWFEHLAHCQHHGCAHPIAIRSLKRKSENYQGLSLVQQEIASGACLQSTEPPVKRARGRPKGSSKKQGTSAPADGAATAVLALMELPHNVQS